MDVKIKKENSDGLLRLETHVKLNEVIIQEDLLNPQNERINLCFIGKNTSGLVELTTKEFLDVYEEVKSRIHLIKGVKILK